MACLSDEQVVLYLAGELSAEERARADAHVDMCEECHAVVVAAGADDAAPSGGGALSSGDTLGHFVVKGWLGRGGMGVVYDAHDRVLDRSVALKVMRPDLESRDALLDEARLAAKVTSPNAVVVYEADVVGELVFVAMERVLGPTLRELARSAPRAAVERAILEAASGLADIHDTAISHGDFKPENVLVGSRGAKITDFGLAHALGQAHRGGGTPRYAAPEQAAGGASPLADQFSFAVTAWELLTGAHPYLEPGARGPVEVGAELAAADEASLTGPLRSALLRALSLDPARRFPSMRALLAAVEAEPPTTRGHAERAEDDRPRRGRSPFWAAVLVGVGLVALLVVAARSRPAPKSPCGELDRRLVTIWSPARRAELVARAELGKVPHAKATWEYGAQQLDRLAALWRAEREDVCLASAVRHELPAAAAQARAACLDEMLTEWEAQIALASASGGAELDELPSMLSQLPSPVRCRRASAREAPSPLRTQLYHARALRRAARVNDTLAASRALLAALDQTSPPSVAAEASALEGWALARSGSAEAVAKLEDALRAAERARDDELRATILVDLVFAYQQRGQGAELPVLESLARSAIQRADSAPALASELDRSLGRAESRRGHHRRALVLFERALAGLLTVYEPNDIVTVPVRLSVAMEHGALGDGRELVRRAEEVERSLAARYPGHPLLVPVAIDVSHGYLSVGEHEKARAVADAGLGGPAARRAPETQLGVLHANRALAYAGLGASEAALADARRARAIFEKTMGDKSARIGESWIAEAEAERSAGRFSLAVLAAERAERILREGHSKDGVQHAHARVTLAAACEANGERARALTHAEAALAFFSSLGDEGNPEDLAKARALVARVLPPSEGPRRRELRDAALPVLRARPWLERETRALQEIR